ncbi:MAG: thiolase family protein [Thermoplasmata archaeon]|nr:thiolase family protein [Thermoplasmata archaeon]
MTVRVSASGIGRFGKRPESLVELMAEAGLRALEGIGRRPVDHLFVGSMAAGSLGGTENLTSQVADRLGLESASGYRVEAASASGAAVFHAAVAAVSAGHAERALVVAGEKMTGLPTAEVATSLARSLSPSESRLGATMPALAALVAQRYLERHHGDAAVFDAVTVQFRESARNNPHAQFTEPITLAEVAKSRAIALPLRLLHCAAISDGAAAVVVERGSGPAQVLGIGEGFDALALSDRPDATTFRATRVAAQRAYETAHTTRKSIGFVEVHDAFAPFALIDLEDLGFCGAGEAGAWFSQGWTRADGRLPVNPSGGILGRGHPVGASGLVQIALVAQQLVGEAGALALPARPQMGLAQSVGGLASHNFVTILGGGAAA